MTIKKCRHYIFLAVYAVVLLFFCTQSSPLYKLNDSFDANAYFTMGKGMMNGFVPYKDLFDHKGPYLYFIYGIAYLISNSSFFGIFLFQSIFMTIVLTCSYKIARLFDFSEKKSMLLSMLVPISTLILTGPNEPINIGGSADEFMMSIFAVALYLIIKGIKSKAIYSKFEKEMFWIGVLSGVIVLIKFNFLLFVVGLLLPVFISLLKTPKHLFKLIMFALLGFVLSLIPYLIYGAVTSSLPDFVKAYFGFNVVYGLDSSPWYKRIAISVLSLYLYAKWDIAFFITAVISSIYCFYKVLKEKKDIVLYASIFLSFALVVFSVSLRLYYYAFIPVKLYFLFFFMIILRQIEGRAKLSNALKVINNDVVVNYCIPCLLIAFTVVVNGFVFEETSKLYKGEAKTCQQKVSDIILADSPENQTLLEILSLDSGFYTQLGIIPRVKHFYKPNVGFSQYEDVFLEQYENVKNSSVAYVVTSKSVEQPDFEYDEAAETADMNKGNAEAKIYNELLKNYSLVEQISGTGNNKSHRVYYLYKSESIVD